MYTKIIISLIFLLHASVHSEKLDSDVEFLEPGSIFIHTPQNSGIFGRSEFRIFCYAGSAKAWSRLFQTVQIRLEIDSDDFTQYMGYCPAVVREHYEQQRTLFSFNLLATKKKPILKLDSFNQTCVGIETAAAYRVRLILFRFDFWRAIFLSVGLFTILYSGKLSENSVFYYLSGIFLGIFASFLILVLLMSKLFPRKPMMYGVMLGGLSLAIYFIQMLLDNFQLILLTYKTYVLWYILITGFASFVICYRLGPPTNQRSKDLIRWTLQFVGAFVIYNSSDYKEAAVSVVIAILISYYYPRVLLNNLRRLYLRKFPPRQKLLTMDEYHEQGVRETAKALDDLKEYCSSPECRQWRVMMRLSDPQRFAAFVEGSPHILNSEMLDFDASTADISDDSDEVSKDESSDNDESFDGDEEVQQRPTNI